MMDTQFTVRRRPLDPMSQAYAHSRSRTTSSNVLPDQNPGHASRMPPEHHGQPAIVSYGNRSPSVNTFSTVSSGMAPPAAYRTSPPNNNNNNNDQVRRSTSSRSGGASINAAPCQTSYVALLRRQKATVWSERAQFEDPRLAAQQKAARMRAQQIVGSGGAYGSSGGRTSTGLSAGGKSKIRHGAKGASTLGFGVDSNYVGIAGVPLRLSATEVEGEDSDEDDLSAAAARAAHHRRTGSSGRSSTASGRRGTPLRTSTGALVSSGSGVNLQAAAAAGAATAGRRPSPNNNNTETTTPDRAGSFQDGSGGGDIVGGRDDAASGTARSTASGGSSSAERGDHVPDLGAAAGRLPANSAAHAAVTRERSVRNAEDLRRRGSVDERTMTMSTGRLFIANPD